MDEYSTVSESPLRQMYGDIAKSFLSKASTKLFPDPNDVEIAGKVARWLKEIELSRDTRGEAISPLAATEQ